MPFKTPINRNNLFYSEADFQFETDIMQGYLEEDTNQTVIVYQVDRKRTNVSSVYKETSAENNIRFMPPVELPCLYEISDSVLKAFDSNTNNGVYSQSGNLTCYIPLKSFEKYDCDIKKGDYLGIQVDVDRVVYFSVTDDGKVNTANNQVVGAYKVGWRVVKAAIVGKNEFSGK